jgi:hypothetical protein
MSARSVASMQAVFTLTMRNEKAKEKHREFQIRLSKFTART